MIAVTVVPIFAPMIKGVASRSLAIFFATIGTTTDVVMVLDRMAAVVTRPHPKDFHGLKKKNRANASGDFAFNRSEINFRNSKIETKRITKAAVEIMKGLGIHFKRNATK